MMRSQRRARRSAFRNEESALRAIVSDLFRVDSNGVPEDEYDCLVHHLLSALHRGVGRVELVAGVESHLRDHFDVDVGASSQAADRVAGEAWTWWSNRRPT